MGRTLRNRKRIGKRVAHSASSDELIGLFKWLKMKVRNQKLRPTMFHDTGRGLMTKRPIYPGDVIIAIPKSFLITMDTVLKSEVGFLLKRSHLKLNLQQAMSIFLITESEKQEESVWWRYIKVLPETFDTPAFWKSSDLCLLSKNVYKKTFAALNDLQTFYDEIILFLSSSKEVTITFNEFRWAWYCINSRSIYYDCDSSPYITDTNKNIALAPFLDLLNHSTTAEVEAAFNMNNNCFEIKTYNSFRKYDQVFISYGAHSNTHLLMEYGFILPDNPHDVYEIDYDEIVKVAQNLNLQYIDKKKRVIEENAINRKLVCSKEGMSWSIHAVLKILAMDFTELKSWKLIFKDDTISVTNQKAVKNMSQIILQQELLEIRSVFVKFPSKDKSRLTRHQNLALDLLTIEENILQQSIKLLQ
ncbi:SET domain-containing protein 4-like [Mytilus californianus]|uniref:SET domain-containing protein 4-like n=1 Tax=Mytilus californianus TaxID=6549 RepID=UPI002245DB3B|nr:SET domain-containing protein 4-like [Mytilus californianus]